MLDKYIHVQEILANDRERFLSEEDLRALIKNKFLKHESLGKNSLLSFVKIYCATGNIKRSTTKLWVTTPGLRRISATVLFEAGHFDFSVSLRIGYRDSRSFQSYIHLRGGFGIRQQRDILSENGVEERKSEISKIAPKADTNFSFDAIGNASVSSAASSGGNESASGEGA